MEDEERQKKLEAGKAKVGFSLFGEVLAQLTGDHCYKVVSKCCRQLVFSRSAVCWPPSPPLPSVCPLPAVKHASSDSPLEVLALQLAADSLCHAFLQHLIACILF